MAIVALVAFVGRGDDVPAGVPVVPTPGGVSEGEATAPVADPFAWAPGRESGLVRRAAAGASHPLYAFSPGGVPASAARTARWRAGIERAAARAKVDPDTLEGLVFLESAGRPDASTSFGTEGAVGLTQILAETGQNFLGLRVDVARSRRYTRRIVRELRRGRAGRVRRLEARRRQVDERYDPAKALAATARYLIDARETFGREDLAFVSYHMGIGNLEGVLRAYAGDEDTPIRALVRDRDLSYARVFFDSSPIRHAAAQHRLAGFGDDSSNYLWKVHAAREVMRLHREDPAALARQTSLQTAKNSREEVLHPPDTTERFGGPSELRDAWGAGTVLALPTDPAVSGLRLDGRMGELARRLDQPASLYRGLRPGALAAALYLGAQVRALSGSRGALTLTSSVRDDAYQRLLVSRNGEATRNYSLHTTGWSFDVARRYASRRQALVFQYVLDRLSLLGVIAWVREPGAIHVTVGEDAEALEPLLGRVGLEG